MAARADPFRDRVAVVTGASRGIGRATALALARAGALVVPLARSADALDALVAEIEAAGGRAWSAPLDLTDERAVRTVLGEIEGRFGRVDILVLNAGIGCQDRIIDLRLDDLRHTFDVNLFGALACLQAVLPGMIARRSGHLVFVSSVAGKRAFPVIGGYAASKWALHAVIESLRHEIWATGVRISTVCPGPVKTGFERSVVGSARRPSRWRPFSLTADQTAAIILRAIARNQREIVVSWPYRLALLALGVVHPYVSPLLWLTLERRNYRTYRTNDAQRGPDLAGAGVKVTADQIEPEAAERSEGVTWPASGFS